MAGHIYQEAFEYAMNELHKEYIAKNDEDTFLLWFNLDYVEDTIDTITASVKTEFLSFNMKKNGYITIIQNKIREITGQENIVLNVIVVKNEINNSPESDDDEDIKIFKSQTIETQNEKTDENDTNQKKKKHPLLNEDFNFDSFIPGENSDYAYKAALAVAQKPGKKYNPILFYGGSGLGKTHLMEAIGNYIYQNNPENLKICYISAENFTNEFTSSITSKKTNDFKNKYRNLDVLLLDDIHFLSGKEATQEELFYTFNALSDKNAQMVFTCDRPIREIQKMANRLVSRLSNGLSIDLQPPNYETRIAILQKKLQLKEKELNPEIIEFIAKNVETNVRELEAALNKVLGYIELFGGSPDLDTVKNQLKDLITANSIENISIDIIQKVIADNYQVSVSDLKSKKRDKKFVIPRQIAIYIAREITEISFMELGNEFGGKDHTTMMHAYEKVKDLIKIDPSLNNKIQLYIREIKEHK
ncbi:MAG: chromosomal replication initiator protein DnaA [Treponema sp.]|nr:chromosomal replication initiator protein DnaA [Spirochaetia bacterium]MDD7768295.1 chromosomal replication initiator protein DnaA [Treponema sp.]MDY3131644.1 chromosomal replication initiator protein DnaA [Treponema sp.]